MSTSGPLPPAEGSSLGHYRLGAALGAGGMGTVYRATDTRLDREVALKVLPAGLAADRDRMGRFIIEAKAASSLSHPGVVHVYEIGEEAGTWYIAMECVEGESLERRLDNGSLPVAEVCEVGAQVADALAAAHARGIIHRDVKPGNIMLTAHRQAKVLDFGIAKVLEPTPPPEGDERLTAPHTATGVVIGTVQYMSPEQALGKKVDARSDLFSLGVVLYHAATGRAPFTGATPTEIIDRILHAEPPPMTRIGADVPEELERIIGKCLRKNPDERYQTAGDIAADLRHMLRITQPGAAAPGAEYYLPRGMARVLALLVQALYIGIYLAALRWSEQMIGNLTDIFGPAAETAGYAFLISALIGIAVRLYVASLLAFDHVRTGIQFRRVFPFILALDAAWAFAPISLAPAWGAAWALACVPPLAFLPFSQRTLIRSAYDPYRPRRTSTGRRPAVEEP